MLEISNVSYEMIGQSTIDTVHLNLLYPKIEYYNELFNQYLKMVKSSVNIATLSIDIGSEPLADMNKNSAEDYLRKAKLYLDSERYFVKIDSTIRDQIKSRKIEQKEFFKAKFFCKATIGGKNILDTLYYIFDKNFKCIDVYEERYIK